MSIYYIAGMSCDSDFLAHHGIKGQKWGVRRYQNPDGSLTPAGAARYGRALDRSQDSAFYNYRARDMERTLYKSLSDDRKQGLYERNEETKKAKANFDKQASKFYRSRDYRTYAKNAAKLEYTKNRDLYDQQGITLDELVKNYLGGDTEQNDILNLYMRNTAGRVLREANDEYMSSVNKKGEYARGIAESLLGEYGNDTVTLSYASGEKETKLKDQLSKGLQSESENDWAYKFRKLKK